METSSQGRGSEEKHSVWWDRLVSQKKEWEKEIK